MVETAIVLLAAGASKRMGQPKQLLSWGVHTLIENAILETLKVNEARVFVVLGANYRLIHEKIENYPVTVLNHLNWEQGIGSSIAFGVSKIDKLKMYKRVVVVLADQPSVQYQNITSLIHSHVKNKSSISITVCNNYKGVPAIFQKDLFSELMLLSDDNGAKSMIKKHKYSVLEFVIDDEILDVDTLEDYQKIIKRFEFN